jgi:hypothetical protein
VIGIFSDSHGDLGAFDAAYELLRAKGAKRFFFVGGRYTDLDEWFLQKREKARGGREYSDQDFLADVSSWLAGSQPAGPRATPKPMPKVETEDLTRVKERFLRVPEKGSLQYLAPEIAKKAVDMVGDTLCCLVHDKNDLNREDLLNATVFVHGKESEPKVVQIGPRFFVTPGKLTGAADQTCGLLDVVEKNLRFSAFTLQGRAIVDGHVLQLGTRTKLSVK